MPHEPTLHAKKSLGQHFLVDHTYLEQIVAAADLAAQDRVLEIGPGLGALTEELAARAATVVAVELDDRLIQPLRTQFAARPHVRIIHGDILELDPAALIEASAGAAACAATATSQTTAPSYKVVANLPYYITSAILRHVLEAAPPPQLVVVLVQLEVAQRICAQPGDLSLLAVSVQYYAQPRLVQRVPAGAFRPRPQVDSAVLRLEVRPRPAIAVAPDHFFAVARAGFSQKRKQLINSLASGLQLSRLEAQAALVQAAIDPTRRAETLDLAEWGRLCAVLAQPAAARPAGEPGAAQAT